MTRDEGPTQTGTPATDAIRKRLRVLRLSQRQLAIAAGVNKNTVGFYLNGETERPQQATLGAIESVLGWPVGTIEAIDDGADPEGFITRPAPVVVPTRTDESPAVSGRPPAGTVYLPPEVESELTEAQAAEVRAHAYAEAMRRRREILHGA